MNELCEHRRVYGKEYKFNTVETQINDEAPYICYLLMKIADSARLSLPQTPSAILVRCHYI